MTHFSKVDVSSIQTPMKIAVVGIACRLPGGVTNPSELWDFLIAKKTGIREIPEDRWDIAMFYDEDKSMSARSVTKWGGFIDDVANFDPQFFGLSPREAASMDPQQRLVLQTAYEAMEDSGMPSDYFTKRRTGVFVGIQTSDYREIQENRRSGGNAFGGTSLALCIVANRVSHRLNLNGPSYAVDTACSSSLTALNQAVLNLRSGQCDHAVVSGINLNLSPKTFLMFSMAGMLSSTGKLSTFDAAANGFVRGEGVGTVILKPLEQAVADGNNIYAVIDESAANQDGFTSTITAPNQDAQMNMLDDLMSRAGVSADMIGYVEAHGTGTPIGDPIEAGAIGRVIGQRKSNGQLIVGSVKPNIGHLESGAGINGLIKVALSIKHGEVPPNINFSTPNPRIPLDALNIHVPTETTAIPEYEGVRRGVVNSFGFGGANASALLSSAPEAPVEGVYRKPVEPAVASAPRLFPITARTEAALAAVAAALATALRKGGAMATTDLGDVAAALGSNRTHHMHRAVVVAATRKELLEGLDYLAAPSDADAPEHVFTGQAASGRKVCFMFAGQGSQWWGMARDLLQNNTVFRETVEAYDTEFVKAAGWSIKEELLRDEASSRIDDTTVTQPALFAIQAGLCAVWKSWGLTPDMVVGHSIGEAAAAYVAGGLSLTGAARFLSKRGAIRDQLGAKGAMAAIGMNVEDVEALLPESGLVGLAAVNGPGSTTISGDFDAVHAFVEEFSAANPNILARILRVDTAWHSYQLEAGEQWFRKEVADIDWSVPELPFISTVTGRPETRFDIDYGWLNLRKPVMFQQGVECALSMGASVFVEMGPHTTLSGPATSTAADKGVQVEVINSLNRKRDDFSAMASAAARLFVGGTTLDWAALNGTPSTHVPLPRYPWVNERFWRDSEEWRALVFPKPTGALLGLPLEGARPSWISAIDLQSYAYLGDHRLQAECVFPGAGYIDLMFEAGRHMFGDGVIEIEHLRIHEALFIPSEAEVRIWTQYVAERNQVQIYSQQRDTNEDWILRADGIIRMNPVTPPKFKPLSKTAKSTKTFDREIVYLAGTESEIINYGPAFQTVRELWANSSRVGARVTLDPSCEPGFERYEVHPATLDACLQISDPRMTKENLLKTDLEMDETFMPIGAQQIRLYRPLPREFQVFAEQRPRPDPLTGCSNFVVVDMDGEVVMQVNGLLNRSLQGGLAKEHPEGFAPHFATESYVEFRAPVPAEDAAKPGRWLALADEDPQGTALVAALRAGGADVQVVSPEDISTDEMTDDLIDLIDEATADEPLEGILFAWNLAVPEIDEAIAAKDMSAIVTQHSKALISLAAALDEARRDMELPRLVLVTRNARPRSDARSMAVDGLTQAPLSAMLRTVANESQDIDMFQIDADAETLAKPEKLVQLMIAPITETEIVLRSSGDYVPRLNRHWPDELSPQQLVIKEDDPDLNFQVTMQTAGVIDNLELVECPLQDIAPGEVRVKVAAVGLNFRDVMAVTGLLPREAEGEPAWRNLGLEFGGTVVAVGKGVKGVKRGDRVMGMGKRCLQRFITVNQSAIAAIPEHISFEEAATIPSAFATAHYALNRVGRLSRGEKVLIHVATGGVGTAAVQMAKNVGAEIFATAGSPAKRKLLKDWGIKHVMNSRDLSFADEVMRKTKGEGVDVVLNSLPGAFIDKGIELLSPYGRFLEIGKRDVYEDNSIGMKALRRNISLSVLDLAAMGVERPQMLGEMFRELSAAFVARDLEPLPLKSFPVRDVADAVRFMSQAKHVGKVVVTFDQETYHVQADRDRDVDFHKKGSYLITGGNGGFGLSIAAWMARAGAGKLILASRSGKVSDEEMPRIREIEKTGTKVDIIAHDVTDEDATRKLIAKLFKDRSYPLKGVLHAAAVIKDGFVTQLTPEMIEDVIWPKVAGAWSLHKAFDAAGQQPDFFINFSSIASLTGAAGQANYVAANAFLDALSTYRAPLGDMGGAINWGAIAATGIVGRNEDLKNYLESMGLKGLEESETPAGIETLLATSSPNLFYANVDWQQMSRTNTRLSKIPRLSGMLQKRSEKSSEVRERLMTLEGEEMVAEIQEFVLREIGNVLKIEPDQIDPSTAMNDLGLDSLSSFELKMRIETALGLSLQVARFLQAPTVEELVQLLAEELEVAKREAALAAERGDDSDDTSEETGASDKALALSDRGIGLLRDAVAPMTTDTARLALEHRVWVEVAPGISAADVKKAAKQISKRHILLKTRFDTKTGNATFDGPGLEVVTVAQVLPDAIAPLDTAGGEVARLTLAGDGSAQSELFLQLHSGVGDVASAKLIIEELMLRLAGEKAPRVLPKTKLRDALYRRIYQAEDPISENDRAFWHYALTEPAPAVEFKERSRALAPADLGRNSGCAVEWLAQSTDNSLTEVDFVTGFADALRDATGHTGSILLDRQATGSTQTSGGAVIAPLASDHPIVVPDGSDRPERAQMLARIIDGTTEHGSIDLYTLRQELSDQFNAMSAAPHQLAYSFGPSQDEASGVYGPFTVKTKRGTNPGIAHDVQIDVSTSQDGAEYVLRLDRDVLNEVEETALIRALTEKFGWTSVTPLASHATPKAAE